MQSSAGAPLLSGQFVTRSAGSATGKGLLLAAILPSLLLAFLASNAQASRRTVLLNYICSTYESARQVALDRSWENPDSMPRDCLLLFAAPMEKRLATIVEIIEVIPIESGQWIEIGKVRRHFGQHDGAQIYSAGYLKQLLVSWARRPNG